MSFPYQTLIFHQILRKPKVGTKPPGGLYLLPAIKS